MICTNNLTNNKYPSNKVLSGGKSFNVSMCYGEIDYFILDMSRDLFSTDTITFIEYFFLNKNDQQIESINVNYEIINKLIKLNIDLNSSSHELCVNDTYKLIIRVHTDDLIKTKQIKINLLDSLGNNDLTKKKNDNKTVIISSNITINETVNQNTCNCSNTICNCNC